jgi:hypothetical protein
MTLNGVRAAIVALVLTMAGHSMAGATATLKLPQDVIAQLQSLRATPKFGPDLPSYTGVLDPVERQHDETAMNDLIDKIAAGIESHPNKKFVLDEFSAALKNFDRAADTEDRERVCMNIEKIMDIVGLESSDGLLNNWLYGFPPPPQR